MPLPIILKIIGNKKNPNIVPNVIATKNNLKKYVSNSTEGEKAKTIAQQYLVTVIPLKTVPPICTKVALTLENFIINKSKLSSLTVVHWCHCYHYKGTICEGKK